MCYGTVTWSGPVGPRVAQEGRGSTAALPAADAGAARAWLDGLVAALPAGMSVRAGISASAGADELGPARREADECLALGEALGERGGGPAPPPAYDESWDDVLLGRLRSAARLGRRPARGRRRRSPRQRRRCSRR